MISERSFTLQGMVTGTPVVKTTTNGIQFGSFYVKVEGMNNGQPTQAYFEVECWSSALEKQYPKAKTGAEVKVNGYITSSSYTAKDGSRRLAYSLRANSIQVDTMSQEAQQVFQPATPQPEPQPQQFSITEDDLPF